jgi:hypothetical protein
MGFKFYVTATKKWGGGRSFSPTLKDEFWPRGRFIKKLSLSVALSSS